MLRLFAKQPIWACSILWFSSYNPGNRNNQHLDRVSEYSKHEVTIERILEICSNLETEQVKSVLKESNHFMVHVGQKDSVIPKRYCGTTEFAQLCYSIVRLTKPSTVVETGVAHGLTSSYLLQALNENDAGHLYSIDLPLLKEGAKEEVGQLVSQSLRSRWTLVLGSGIHEMRKLSKRINKIDIFIHDSNHSYLNQLSEYKFALKWLGRRGFCCRTMCKTMRFWKRMMKFAVDCLLSHNQRVHMWVSLLDSFPFRFLSFATPKLARMPSVDMRVYCLII